MIPQAKVTRVKLTEARSDTANVHYYGVLLESDLVLSTRFSPAELAVQVSEDTTRPCACIR